MSLRGACFAAAGFCLTIGHVSPARAESVARRWNEAIIAAIRLDVPNPPVHARNLFHLSAAMWDAWAAYDETAVGYVHRERQTALNVEEARREAISYAAYRVLVNRFSDSVGAAVTLPALQTRLSTEGFDAAVVTTTGNSPAAVGNRVAASVLAFANIDGSNQAGGYTDSTYFPVNPPLVLADGGTTAVNPNRWQPLAFAKQVAQNGIELPDKVQSFIGAVVKNVRPFALMRGSASEPWANPGAPPQLGGATDSEYKAQHFDVLRLTSRLTSADPAVVDISPGVVGKNSLASNSGTGHPLNPATGQPYAQNPVNRGDFGRVLAEFWADGPHSETPPGHWNVFANQVADHPLAVKRLRGEGPVLNDLEWDVKIYFALNAAVHDAACMAWTLKRYYDSARPITAIRYMAQRGQSSNSALPSYHVRGLPLEDGLAEIITASSAAPGGRHAHLAGFIGQIAIRGWAGEPANPATTTAGVVWMLGKNWVPYQRKTFVTPAFPGYISGHSTFSRAAAEVLAAATGSPFFPGGLSTHTVPAGQLLHEEGPSTDVTLQWATYFDAADQAGQSRLWGGIHIVQDDFDGRICGAQAGLGAWELAQKYFDGSILTELLAPELVLDDAVGYLSCPMRRGIRYRLQSSEDLQSWTDAGAPAVASEISGLFSVSAGPNRGFFRILRD